MIASVVTWADFVYALQYLAAVAGGLVVGLLVLFLIIGRLER